MHPLLDVRPWPRILLQHPLLLLTAALLGAGGAFAYSYAPLHRAKDWQIEYLQGRLASRTEQVTALEEELRVAQSSLEGQPSSDELSAARAQLDEATRLSGSLQEQVRELEKKLDQVTRSRDSWRSKHASAIQEIESLRSTAAAPVPRPPDDSPGDSLADSNDSTSPDPNGGPAPAARAPAAGVPPGDAPTP